ncbi:MAG: restriction endonuclease subunit S [Bacteroidales bacterium]|nr:restriction endonuclease subunit S [Bacteroidales bacterium]
MKSLREISLSSGEYGANTPATKYNSEVGRYIRITDIDEFGNLNNDIVSPEVAEDKYLLREGDLLFARTGATVGKTYLHKEGKALYAGYLIKYRFTDAVLPDFVFAYTHSQEYYEWVELTQKVGAQPNISAKQYDGLKIIVPPIEEQKSFVALMHQADKSKFAGFKSQFISQFGFPQDGDVKHPTSSIEALLEETISGEWGTDCADASGTRVIRTTNFTNDGVLNLDDVVLRSIDQKKVEKKQLHKGDIILEKSGGTKDNPVGRLVFFAEDGIYLANNFTQVLRPSNSVNSRYLFAALYYLYQTHKPLIKGLGNQTNGIQNLKVPQYLQLQVCVPDRKEQDAFEEVLQHADKSKYLN